MSSPDKALLDAACAFADTEPCADNGPAFHRAYRDLLEARRLYETWLLAGMADPRINDPGAFSSTSHQTSVTAAFTVPGRGSLRWKMLKLFADPRRQTALPWAAEREGFTDFELAAHFERDPRTIGSCRRDLVLAGWIDKEGSVRFKPNDPGEKRPCTVWVMTDIGRQKYEELKLNG